MSSNSSRNLQLKKKILIAGYYYEPEITPRSFRTKHLVEEFKKREYKIDLFIPYYLKNNEIDSDVNTQYVSTKKNMKSKTKSRKSETNLKNYLKLLIIYLIGQPKEIVYSIKLYRKLLKNADNNYDLIISIGLPFYIHLAMALYFKTKRIKGTKVADYGDPFSKNPNDTKAYYFRWIESWVINKFDYISIPTRKSLKYYESYIKKENIKIIPQGFNLEEVPLPSYQKNNIPTFAYSGIFYKGIRNPEFFFKRLMSLDINFKFIVYTKSSGYSREIAEKYKKYLGPKLEVRDYIPRKDLIRELSKMDFLVNFENINSGQSPSKIIDYTLSGRPFISINEKEFNENLLLDFIKRDYNNSSKVDIERFDIKRVTNEFETLID